MTSVKAKILGAAMLLLAVSSVLALTALAAPPNYGRSTHPSPLHYVGYVQCQPSFWDNGFHAARGFFVYRNGRHGEQWTFTAYGQSAQDSAIYSASSIYWDHFDPWHPQVTFNYNFDWVPIGSGIWPN